MERTVLLPKLQEKRGPRVVLQPAETPTPSAAQDRVGDLVDAAEARYDKYCDQLDHQKQCKTLLQEAIGCGEFSAAEIKSLERSVTRQVTLGQPLLDDIIERVIAAQEAWRRKQAAMENVQELLERKEYAQWQQQHDALEDRLDQLIERIKGC